MVANETKLAGRLTEFLLCRNEFVTECARRDNFYRRLTHN